MDICGIGNGLVDVIVNVSEEQLRDLGVPKGSMRLVTRDSQQAILDRLGGGEARLVSGGSVANSIIAAAQLGRRAGYITRLGVDRYGDHYAGELDALGIRLGGGRIAGEPTGTCLVLVTPDAERTMQTCLGASALVGADSVEEDMVAGAAWVLLEGYLLASPSHGLGAVRRAAELARKHRVRIAFSVSALFIIENFRDPLEETIERSDLVFANAEEAMALTGAGSAEAAADALAARGRGAAVTAGAEGAHIRLEGRRFHCPSFACRPVDLTGAGDMFAGAFLAGIAGGVAPELSARGAGYLAMKVITQVGARLWKGAREHWDEALRAAPPGP